MEVRVTEHARFRFFQRFVARHRASKAETLNYIRANEGPLNRIIEHRLRRSRRLDVKGADSYLVQASLTGTGLLVEGSEVYVHDDLVVVAVPDESVDVLNIVTVYRANGPTVRGSGRFVRWGPPPPV